MHTSYCTHHILVELITLTLVDADSCVAVRYDYLHYPVIISPTDSNKNLSGIRTINVKAITRSKHKQLHTSFQSTLLKPSSLSHNTI